MISNKILLIIISVLILIMGILEAATDNLLGDYRMYHGILLIIIATIVSIHIALIKAKNRK